MIPTPETHPTQPASPYGVSKVAFELYLAAWGAIHGVSGISLRYANIYGPRQNPLGEAGVIAIFCHRLLSGEPPVVNGDGEQTRDFVFVGDVAAANLRALERPDVTGPVNVGTGVETSVNTLYERLAARRRHQPAGGAGARPARRAAPELPRPRAGRAAPRMEPARLPRRGPGAHVRVLRVGNSAAGRGAAGTNGERTCSTRS